MWHTSVHSVSQGYRRASRSRGTGEPVLQPPVVYAAVDVEIHDDAHVSVTTAMLVLVLVLVLI